MQKCRLCYFVAWLMLVSALFLPKLNFIDLGGATYIRLDDFLVALFFVFYVLPNCLMLKAVNTAPRWLVAFFLFIAVSLLSSVLNAWFFGRVGLVQSILYSLRHVEYFIYIYAGVEFAKRDIVLRRLFIFLVWYLFFLVVLQHFGLIHTFGGFSNERASANTAGPFELAVVLSFLIIYLITEVRGGWFRAITIISAVGLLFWTQSRITVIGMLLVISSWYILRIRVYRSTGFYIYLIFLLACVIVFLFANPESLGVLDRFYSILNTDIYEYLYLFSDLPLIQSSAQYYELAYDDLLVDVNNIQGDSSSFIRFYRWTLLISMIFSDFSTVVFGAGPSFASVAVDGFYVRLLAETGILGLVSYLAFILYIYRVSSISISMRYYCIVLLISAAFIDIFTSSKAMFIFWFWFGYSVLPYQKIKEVQPSK